MNSLKTVIIVVVLAAVGYVVYACMMGGLFSSVFGRRDATSPEAAGDAGDVTVNVPGPGAGRHPGPAADASGTGPAPSSGSGKGPSISVNVPRPPADPSAPPEVRRASAATVPPAPASAATTPASAATAPAKPPAPGQAQPPEGEVRPAFAKFLAEAHSYLDAGLAARDAGQLAFRLKDLTQYYKDPKLTPVESLKLTELLDQVAGTLIYSRQHLMEAPYQVRSGDTLQQIAQQYNVPWELLAKINGIRDPENLRPGQKIKVVQGPFHAVIDLADHEMTLLLRGNYYAGRFPVAGGRDHEALLGDHAVLRKNPPAPNDPQGGLSLELSDRLTIQGIGQADPAAADSPGTIRLGRRDIEDVYHILSVGSRVFIRR